MTEEGPSFLELARQALSSTTRGYDLLAPKFEFTAYATPTEWIEEALGQIRERYPLSRPESRGLDLACGTGRGARALTEDCALVLGVDFSRGMLEQAQALSVDQAELSWRESDLAAVQIQAQTYDRVVTFGAWGHILPSFRVHLLRKIVQGLKPGGVFLTLTADRSHAWERRYWQTLAFDSAIKVRNLFWFKEFHMYYGINTTEELSAELSLICGPEFDLGLDRLPSVPNLPITLLSVHRRPDH